MAYLVIFGVIVIATVVGARVLDPGEKVSTRPDPTPRYMREAQGVATAEDERLALGHDVDRTIEVVERLLRVARDSGDGESEAAI